MATPTPADRIRLAIADAKEQLARRFHQTGRSDQPAPGELFVFDAGDDVGLEWLVVRSHPDDDKLLLLAPADDFPLVGTTDVPLSQDLVGRPLTVRCGETDWFPASLCEARLRLGAVPEAALALVRQRLADLARGREITTENPSDDLDPEYEDWIGDVARARCALLARAGAQRPVTPDVIPVSALTATPPALLTVTPEYSLAAETGSTLFAELGKTLAEPDGLKYHEVADFTDGKLYLLVDAAGVRAVWAGAADRVPPLAGMGRSGEQLSAAWHTDSEQQLSQTEQSFPWIDGQVVLHIGTVPPRALAIQL